MTPLVPEAHPPRWSLERLSVVIAVVVALALLAGVIAVTRTIGAQPIRLPSWHRQPCDDQLILDRADGTPGPRRGCHAVKAL